MAVTRSSTSSVLKLKLDNGKSESGEQKTVTRTFSHFSQDLPDEDFLRIGKELGALQSRDIMSVTRTDSAELDEEA